METVAEHCVMLLSFGVTNETNSDITQAPLLQLVENCTRLKELMVCNVRAVNDKLLHALAKHGPQLLKVNVSGCSLITDDGVCALVKHCTKLAMIGLCGKLITDTSLFAIAQHCGDLHFVYFDECNNISQVGMKALVEDCKKLTFANVNHKLRAMKKEWAGENPLVFIC